MAPLIAALFSQGLDLLGNAVMAKGKEVVEEKLGIDLSKPPDPAAVTALKQAEFQHEEWLVDAGIRKQELELKEVQTYLADVQDARGMQREALAQTDLFAKRFVYYFAIALLAFSAIYIFGITFFVIPKENIRFADNILGFLMGTLIATIVNFFYGTSKGSKDKDSTLDAMVKKFSEK